MLNLILTTISSQHGREYEENGRVTCIQEMKKYPVGLTVYQ